MKRTLINIDVKRIPQRKTGGRKNIVENQR